MVLSGRGSSSVVINGVNGPFIRQHNQGMIIGYLVAVHRVVDAIPGGIFSCSKSLAEIEGPGQLTPFNAIPIGQNRSKEPPNHSQIWRKFGDGREYEYCNKAESNKVVIGVKVDVVWRRVEVWRPSDEDAQMHTFFAETTTRGNFDLLLRGKFGRAIKRLLGVTPSA
ncbi:hypothetical protein CPB86DRAFT_798099 [Serendipita vermifera]|nr:hypothetical protein CPB86DRAFT_798099 [Serendipita vermifera]